MVTPTPSTSPRRLRAGQWCSLIFLAACAPGLLAACVRFSTSSSGGTDPGSGAESSGATESPAAVEERQRARAAFEECAARFDELFEKWKAQDEKTKKVIAEVKDKPFYEAFGKLSAQFTENCRTAQDLVYKGTDRRLLDWAQQRGTANELAMAIARLQVRHKMTPDTPLSRTKDDYVRHPVLTGDADFDRNEFCSSGAGYYKWLPPKEREAQLARRKELLDAQLVAINTMVDAINAERDRVGADYGRVKSVKKGADGSLEITVKNLYGGAVCQHTGNWTYNGTFWSDCSYAPAPEKEIYPFTVKLAADRVPPSDVKAGDVISVWGFRTPGPDARDPKANAKYEGIYVDMVRRGTKDVWNVEISVAGEMTCLR